MNTPTPFPDTATSGSHHDEADIGSGEKTPAEKETEEMIRQIPKLPPSGETERKNEEDDKNKGYEASPGRP
jgi:hypothetical protein